MSKAKFQQIVKSLSNSKTIEVNSKNYMFEITILNKGSFLGTIYRLSKNKKERIEYFDNSIPFYYRLMRLAETKNLNVRSSLI